MAVPFSGYGMAIGVGKETTWGTAVARGTNWLRAAKWSLARQQIRETIAHLTHGDAGDVQEEFSVREEAGGGISFPLRYVGVQGLILEAIFGLVATTGASPYVHTYTMASTLPSLTLEGRRGNSVISEVFEGCKGKSAVLSCSVGEVATLGVDFMAQTGAVRGASGTPAYGAGEPVAFHQMPTVTFNSVAYTVKSYSLEFANELGRVDELGSLTTAEPGFSGLRTVRLKATLAYRSDTLYVAQNALTSGDVTWTHTGATSPNSLALTLKAATLQSVSDPVETAGYLEQQVEWLGHAAGAVGSCIAVVTNGQSAHSAG